MTVVIIDYGMGNLNSVRRAFEECGANVVVSQNPASLKTASHIVLPGVGSFAEGSKNLTTLGFRDAICHAAKNGVPLLGICLGMQLLLSKGHEGGDVHGYSGLDLIPGEVVKLKATADRERIPHMGWNEIYPEKECALFHNISPGTDVYFVHSYHAIPENQSQIAARTPYCGGFVSAVSSQNIFGVQFHPEKSSRMGFEVIKNFLQV